MTDIIITAVLILVTVGLIALLRLITKSVGETCRRPRAEMTVYFDENCECLEYTLQRILESPAVAELDLRLTVYDSVGTEESRQWLCELKRKLGGAFEISGEGESNGTGEDGNYKRNG